MDGLIALEKIRNILDSIGMRGFAAKIMKVYARLSPVHTVKRRGVWYKLNIEELIDYGIYMGGWEKATITYLEKSVKPGYFVVEVGANVGSHTLLMAKHAGRSGRVYAFEPTEYAASKLQANLDLNKEIDNVVLRREMVTNSGGDLPNLFIQSTWALGGKHVEPCKLESPRSISLDRFASEEGIDRIDLIKIDVDGYDYKVLEGGKGIINRFKPIIFCELYEKALREQGDSIEKIFALLGSLGYEAHADDGTSLLGGADDVIRITGYDGSVNGVFLQKRD